MKQIQKKMILFLALILIVLGICVGCGKKEDREELQQNQPSTEQKLDNESEEKEEVEDTEGEDSKEEEEYSEELDDSKAVTMKATTNVNLRKEPNTDCEVIKVISKGTELKKYSEENGWAKVKCGEDVGYVSSQYIADPASVPEEPQTPSNTNKVEAIPGQHRDPNSAVVVIDPGHQRSGDSTKEPNGPGSSTMKARVTSGTTGVSTGVPEYILNLDVSLKLKTELENRGYTVYMTRSTHDVNISNMERA